MDAHQFYLCLRDMLFCLQIGFGFVRDAVVCSVLERTCGFEPSSETTAPRYLKHVSVSFTLISLWMPLFVITLIFSALMSIPYLVQVWWRL